MEATTTHTWIVQVGNVTISVKDDPINRQYDGDSFFDVDLEYENLYEDTWSDDDPSGWDERMELIWCCELEGLTTPLLDIRSSRCKYAIDGNLIAKFIEANTGLSTLAINPNSFLTDEHAVMIANALKANTNLRVLKFRCRLFTQLGVGE